MHYDHLEVRLAKEPPVLTRAGWAFACSTITATTTYEDVDGIPSVVGRESADHGTYIARDTETARTICAGLGVELPSVNGGEHA